MFVKLLEKNEELQQIICNQNEKLHEQNEKLMELAKQPKTIIKKQNRLGFLKKLEDEFVAFGHIGLSTRATQSIGHK